MPRPERVLDPDDGPIESLAAELREQRRQAGNPGYRELAARAGFSVSTLAEAAGGRHLPTLAVTLAFVRACDGEIEEWEQRWRLAAAEVATTRTSHGGCGGEPPYRGLTGYGVADGGLYFGRRQVVTRLVELLDRQRLVAVVGVSGSGKSSLLRAGLVPAVAGNSSGRTSTPPADGCLPVLMTPGSQPITALREALRPIPPNRDVLLIVDQFEEVFTLCRVPAQRNALVTELAALVNDPDRRVRVVLGVRADFYARSAELPRLAHLMAGASVVIPPLTDDELREVITGPARVAGLKVERALTTKILADASGEPGTLPLISHALLETWRQRRGDLLTVAGYEAAGGLAGAVAQTAEAVYERFDAVQRATAHAVLTRLVTLGDGVEDTRRRVRLVELDFPGVQGTLEALAAARLVVLAEDTVEIAHEALIRAWPRLRGWLQADREALRMHRQLTDASQVWQSLDGDPDALYRGARLAAWDGQPLDRLNDLETEFLTASRERETRDVTARRRRVRLAVASLIAAVVAVSLLASLAIVQANKAADERDLAQAGRLAANARAQLQLDPEIALLLAREAEKIRSTEETRAVLRQATEDSRARATLSDHQGQVMGVSYSPDGRRVASSGTDGTVRIWPLSRDGLPQPDPMVLRGHTGEVRTTVFSPDGSRLVSVGRDGTVRVWDPDGARQPVVLPGRISAAFSPDGRRLAALGQDGMVQIWDIAGQGDPSVVRIGGKLRAVAFSPDGGRLAVSTTAGPISIWDLRHHRQSAVLRGHEGWAESLAFSPDGKLVASASMDGTARLWHSDGSGEPMVLRGHDGAVAGVTFSRDGRRLATTGQDGTIRVWNVGSPVYPMLLRGHRGMVSAASFSPDGRLIASASDDGTVRFWDSSAAGDLIVLDGHRGEAWMTAFSQDGRQLVSSGVDGTVRVRQTTGEGDPVILRGHAGETTAADFSPDGRRVASSGEDGTVRIWDATGKATPPTVLHGHTGFSWSVVFSPDGNRLVSAGQDGTVRIWPTDGARAATVLRGHQGSVRQATFSSDGRLVASAGKDTTVRIWPATGGAPVVQHGHEGPVRAVAFSPDGRHVASGGNDGTVRIWPTNEHGDATILRGHQGVVWSVAFSPDGHWIAGSGNDGTVRIWPTIGGEPIVYRGFGATVEGISFGSDYRLATAHSDGTVRVWRCTACAPIEQVRALANARATRQLSSEENRIFLGHTSR